MKPLREWTQRSRTLLTLALAALGMLVVVAIATYEDEPTPAETARYEQVRAECTLAAEAVGLEGRQRVKAINRCMLDRY